MTHSRTNVEHCIVDPGDSLGLPEARDLSIGCTGREGLNLELIECASRNFFSVEEAPDLLMDTFALARSQSLQNEHVIITVIALQHADHVRGVDEAVAAHLVGKLLALTIDNVSPEVAQDFLMLILHVDVIEFAHNKSMVVAVLQKSIC